MQKSVKWLLSSKSDNRWNRTGRGAYTMYLWMRACRKLYGLEPGDLTCEFIPERMSH